MVKFKGDIKSSSVSDERATFVFEMPAFRKKAAERRARANMRFKGFNSPKVQNIQQEESTDIPGQKIYEVTVTAPV